MRLISLPVGSFDSFVSLATRTRFLSSMTRFQRIALTAFITVEVLIFAGAIVRATGSGLGCPDWPFCYGRWIPPTSADQIDFTKLSLEKFKARCQTRT